MEVEDTFTQGIIIIEQPLFFRKLVDTYLLPSIEPLDYHLSLQAYQHL